MASTDVEAASGEELFSDDFDCAFLQADDFEDEELVLIEYYNPLTSFLPLKLPWTKTVCGRYLGDLLSHYRSLAHMAMWTQTYSWFRTGTGYLRDPVSQLQRHDLHDRCMTCMKVSDRRA